MVFDLFFYCVTVKTIYKYKGVDWCDNKHKGVDWCDNKHKGVDWCDNKHKGVH